MELLQTSSRSQAVRILTTAPRYSDLSFSNYVDALDWLKDKGLVTKSDEAVGLPEDVFLREVADIAAVLDPEEVQEPWLLPEPVLAAAEALGIPEADAWQSAIALGQKIDLERRARIGALGELAVVRLLGELGCEVRHESLVTDGLGWDITARLGELTRHFEVKTTTSVARLRVYLSRHEFQVSTRDPSWAMLAALIMDTGQLVCVAHVSPTAISSAIPIDSDEHGRWESCRIDLAPKHITPGIPLPVPCTGVIDIDDNSLFLPGWWPWLD
jgi:hypothetical protein